MKNYAGNPDILCNMNMIKNISQHFQVLGVHAYMCSLHYIHAAMMVRSLCVCVNVFFFFVASTRVTTLMDPLHERSEVR